MQITELKLTNFRNYESLNLKFSKNINIIIGNNGEGKTNILESIYVLSLTKSNRYGVENNLINKNKTFLKINGIVKCDDIIRNHLITMDFNSKKLFINDKEIRKSRDYISNFCVISFSPDDLDIIKGSPSIRRNLLNIDISQLYNNYINYLNEYNMILKMRNEYLKKININGNTDTRYLDILSDKLIDKATYIYNYRYLFVEMINENIEKIYHNISGLNNLKIVFSDSLNMEKYDKDLVTKRMKEKFKKNYYQELLQGNTFVGPHRDDFIFELNGENMKEFASEGQQRMAIIAFKISELLIFKKISGNYPVLLLDDIFSEIDIKKRNKIIKFLRKDIQTIITTTDINDINEKLLENATIFYVKNNNVTRKGGVKNERR